MDRLREAMKWRYFSLRLRIEDRISRAFDVKYGVETTTEVDLADCGLSPEARERGNRLYRVTWAGLIDKSLRRLDIDHRRYSFLDLGAGKGKAMLRASNYPYKRIIGVEYAEALHRVAVTNCRIYRNPEQKCFSLTPIHADALVYEPPPGPLVCFMCNPFDHDTLARVFQRLRRRVESGDRDLRIIYVNMRTISEADPVLREETWLRPTVHTQRYVIFAPERHTRVGADTRRFSFAPARFARSPALAIG